MMEGTSAAAAHVGGVVALLLSQTGPIPPQRIYHAVRTSSRRISGLHVIDAARLLFRATAVAK